jgi:hypothetical protein
MMNSKRLVTLLNCLFFVLVVWSHQLNGAVKFERHTVDSNFRAFFITAFDVDKDGDPDIISGRWQLAWWRNDGDANFTKKVLGNFTRLFSVFPVDIDKDGDIDLLTADIEETTIRLYKNNGSNRFEEIHLIDDINRAESVAAADFDKDGDLDIAVVTCETQLAFWCENNGNLKFNTRHILSTRFDRGHKVAVVDFDDDGWVDIVGVAGSFTFCWWRNLGNKEFSEVYVMGYSGLGFGLGDITDNGATDIVHCYHGGGIVTLLSNNGGGSFSKKTISTGENWPSWATIGDLNSDGENDFILVNAGYRAGPYGNLVYFENNGNKTFDRFVVNDSEMNVPFMAELADFDRDGDLDIVSGYEYENKLYWWENKRGGNIETVSQPNTPNGPSSGNKGSNLEYSTGGSTSSLGHEVEYRFNWGDGDISSWGSATRSHTFPNSGTFQVRAQARCETHTTIESDWSGSKTVTITGITETVSKPDRPSGSTSGIVDQTMSYTTGGSESNLGHSVEYQFNWGDGDQSGWGSESNSHVFTNAGSFQVRARARCKTHTNIVSDYSSSRTVTIVAETVSGPNTPSGPSSGVVGENLAFSTDGAECNYGHDVQYQYSWDDGQQSNWGEKTQQHSYTQVGTYKIRARARCATHPYIASEWSGEVSIQISPNQYQVSGEIVYYSNQIPIQNVTVGISGDVTNTIVTDTDGNYNFTVEAGKDFVIIPDKQKGEHVAANDITVYDAVLVARYIYKYQELSPDQQISADANQDNMLNLYDAVLIARYAVGLTHLQSSCVAEWLFSPGERSYQNINESKSSQNFTGFIVGNVNGDWNPVESQKKYLSVSQQYLGLTHIQKDKKNIKIPLTVDSEQEVLSVDIEIIYNTDDLNFVSHEKTEYSQNFKLIENDEPGRLRMGMYSVKPAEKQGNLVNIIFKIKNTDVKATNIELKKFLVNNMVNKQTNLEIEFNQESLEIKEFKLFQNYPNPFNSETKIDYQLAKSGEIQLGIYNSLGQQICLLVSGKHNSGIYTINWNGKDAKGDDVPSGVYFYKLKTNNYLEVRKLLYLR